MKVLLINGSPHKDGCTNRALEEVKSEIIKENIECDIVHLGNKPIISCMGCSGCRKIGKCVYDDIVNEIGAKLDDYDGFVFGTPVHYASSTGAMSSFLDRLFYSHGSKLRCKVGACVVSARRSGTTSTFDQMNKYFSISSMITVSSTYWNNVHGYTKEDVEKDLEGLQTMRNLGKNIAFILKCIEEGKKKGITFPEQEKTFRTNFMR